MHPILQNFNRCNAIHFTFNLQTKLEMSSFIRSKDIAWPKNLEMAHVTLTTSTRGIVRHHKANTSRGQTVYEI